MQKHYLVEQDVDAPDVVDSSKVDRFMTDINELLILMESKKPPQRLVRGRQVLLVRYSFGDASGGGFGSSWESSRGISFRFGVWNERDNKGRSSNYRELKNLVESLESMCNKEELGGNELFFFTDNSTTERAYYKGTSTNPDLPNLVFRLRWLEMEKGLKIIKETQWLCLFLCIYQH